MSIIMEFVEPIREKRKIEQIKNALRGGGKIRDLLLFELGINSALRISDLLSIQVHHLYDNDGKPKEYFEIIEEKTTKKHKVTITPKVQRTLLEYKATYPSLLNNQNNYIFFHQKKHELGIKAIDRKMAWLLIDRWCSDVGLRGNHGGHTLRKTRGYQARIAGVPIELIQHKLNHSSLAITKRYLGVTDDEIQEACNNLDL